VSLFFAHSFSFSLYVKIPSLDGLNHAFCHHHGGFLSIMRVWSLLSFITNLYFSLFPPCLGVPVVGLGSPSPLAAHLEFWPNGVGFPSQNGALFFFLQIRSLPHPTSSPFVDCEFRFRRYIPAKDFGSQLSSRLFLRFPNLLPRSAPF